MNRYHERAFEVCAHQGHVLIDGPAGMAATLTPDAADETAHRLIEQAAQAHGQSVTGQVLDAE